MHERILRLAGLAAKSCTFLSYLEQISSPLTDEASTLITLKGIFPAGDVKSTSRQSQSIASRLRRRVLVVQSVALLECL